jgi:hypothetical protein
MEDRVQITRRLSAANTRRSSSTKRSLRQGETEPALPCLLLKTKELNPPCVHLDLWKSTFVDILIYSTRNDSVESGRTDHRSVRQT